jgi:superfamily II DNA or RNA helicase
MLDKSSLREWQRKANDVLVQCAKSEAKRALIYACPGAGKTIASLFAARSLAQTLQAEAVVVVTSNIAIKSQWIETAKTVGADLREVSDFRDLHQPVLPGFGLRWLVVSYQQVALNKESLDLFCTSNRVIAVFDEVHHTAASNGVRDGNKWGMTITYAFRKVLFALCTTGTPFREQTHSPIAFVHYNDEGEVVPTVAYPYKDAIKDGVCRPIEFEMYDGTIEWRSRKSGRVLAHDFSDKVSKSKERERLVAAISMDGQFPVRMLEAAHAKLLELRSGSGVDARAGGLVVAMDRSHAEAIAEVLTEISGKRPTLVHSRLDDAQEQIKAFKESDAEWIIGIAMLSEGVDIPRLRVGVYMTNVRASLFFHQFCGRFARVQVSKEERSFVFLPCDPEIQAIATKIEQEKCHALGEDPQAGPAGQGRGGPRVPRGIQVEDSDSEVVVLARSGLVVPVDFVRRHRSVINDFRSKRPSYHGHSDLEVLTILVDAGAIEVPEAVV